MSSLTWSGSATTVSSGESSADLLIRMFDTLLVDHGGTVTDSTITGAGLGIQGGTVNQDPPGSALVFGVIESSQLGGDVISAGTTYVGPGGIVALGAGGLAMDINLDAGSLVVESGAVAKDISGGGYLTDGGQAFNVNVEGVMGVDGGTASNTTVTFGELGIYSGGVAYNTKLTGPGSVESIAGGTASVTAITGVDSEQIVSAGGVAISTTLGKGTESVVSAGGATTSTTVGKGAVQIVLAGGSAVDTTIDSGGTLLLLGGHLTGDVVQPGGTLIDSGVIVLGEALQYTSSGLTSTSAYGIDGTIIAFYPTVARNVTVGPSAEIAVVLSGGKALGMTDEFAVAVWASGYASGTKVEAGASLVVSGGGVAYATDVFANVGQDSDQLGSATVLAGGRLTSSTVDTGVLVVSSGGLAGHTTVAGSVYTSTSSNGDSGPASAYGEAIVLGDGVASGVTLDYLGALLDYGIAGGIVVSSGGIGIVEHGAKTTGTQVSSGGTEEVFGVASGTVLTTNAKEDIEAGGVASNSVEDGARIDVSGSGVHLSASGGSISVFAGGRVLDTTVFNGGDQIVSSGGIASGTVLSGGDEQVSGQAYDTTTDGDGGEAVYAGGETFNDVLSGVHADETVFGGIASHTIVSAGAELTIDGTGSALSAQIGSGGEIEVSQGSATRTTVGSGATMTLFGASGLAMDTVVQGGGYVSAADSGAFVSGTIDGGAKLYLIQAAVASALTVLSGGLAIIDEGGGSVLPQGLLHSAVIESGGTLEVLSANEFAGLTNVTVDKGGIVAVGGIVVATGQVVQTPGVQAAATNFSGIAVKAGGIVDDVNAFVSSGGELQVTPGVAAITPTVDSGGTIVIASGASVVNGEFDFGASVTDDGTIVVNAPANGGQSTIFAPISGTGGLQFNGSGLMVIERPNTFSGGITLGSGATLDVDVAGGAGSGAIDMGGAPIGAATITLEYTLPANNFSNEITGFGLGDAIVLDAVGFASGYTVAINGNAVTLETSPGTSYTFDIAGASQDRIVPALAPGNVTMLSAIAPSPPPMAAGLLAPPGGSVVPAGPHALAQAISATEVFQARAASASLHGSEGFGSPGVAPLALHLGGMLTDLHAVGPDATTAPAAHVLSLTC